MKVLLNDGMDLEGIALFEEAGIKADTKKRNHAALLEQIGEFSGLIVRSATNVSSEIIEAGAPPNGNLVVIGRAGVGYDNIDIRAASKYGVVVKNAPGGNTESTAQMALLLMMSVARNLPQAHHSLKDGIWRKKQFEGTELYGKTLGIIGCGRIGQRLSELVAGFNVEVIGYDPKPNPDSRIRYMSKEEVISKADFISIHVNGAETIIGYKELSLMKPTAYLINTARGTNVHEEALFEALTTGKVAGAALDVYAQEPREDAAFESMFRKLRNVVLSSHLSASTREAQKKTSMEIASVVIDYMLKGDYTNAVNARETVEAEERPTYPIHIFNKDEVGAFAAIDAVLERHGISIRETPSRVIGEDGNAKTTYKVLQPVSPEVLAELNQLSSVHWAIAPGL